MSTAEATAKSASKRGTPRAQRAGGEEARSADRQLNEAVAHLKFARMGPRKLRRVADAIRGKSVQEALTLLQFAGVFAAEPMEKLLRSAVANAENNHDMNVDALFVTRVTVDGGPGGRFTKRLDPRAQGRANFKRKRLSHVTIAVGEQVKSKAPGKKAGASIGTKRKTRKTATTARPKAAAQPTTATTEAAD